MDAYISVRLPEGTTVRAFYFPASSTGSHIDTPMPERVSVRFHAGTDQIDLLGDAEVMRLTFGDALAAVTEAIVEGRS